MHIERGGGEGNHLQGGHLLLVLGHVGLGCLSGLAPNCSLYVSDYCCILYLELITCKSLAAKCSSVWGSPMGNDLRPGAIEALPRL